MLPFDDDPLDDLFRSDGSQPAPRRDPPAHYRPIEEQAPKLFEERCRKCGGSGMWRPGYSCFACKGRGKLAFKSSPVDRARARDGAADRKERKQVEALEAFQTEHADIWAWMDGSTFPFAVSLRENLARWGSLTDNQVAAARRAIGKLAEAKAVSAARAIEAPAIAIDRIAAAFRTAAGNGLRRPRLRIAEFTFSPAGASSRNPDAIYVKEGDTYLGRVTDGRFVASRDCSDTTRDKVLQVAADPQAAAVAHGKLTGNCSCCGRLLTDPISVANGIGPICASNYGW